jgi:hypothetical protein
MARSPIDPLAAVASAAERPLAGFESGALDRAALVVEGLIEEIQDRANIAKADPRDVGILLGSKRRARSSAWAG